MLTITNPANAPPRTHNEADETQHTYLWMHSSNMKL
jgi:hypothetical protein